MTSILISGTRKRIKHIKENRDKDNYFTKLNEFGQEWAILFGLGRCATITLGPIINTGDITVVVITAVVGDFVAVDVHVTMLLGLDLSVFHALLLLEADGVGLCGLFEEPLGRVLLHVGVVVAEAELGIVTGFWLLEVLVEVLGGLLQVEKLPANVFLRLGPAVAVVWGADEVPEIILVVAARIGSG